MELYLPGFQQIHRGEGVCVSSGVPKVNELLFAKEDREEVKLLLKKLCDLGAMTKSLQDEEFCLYEARILFGAVITRFFPTTVLRLSANTSRVQN